MTEPHDEAHEDEPVEEDAPALRALLKRSLDDAPVAEGADAGEGDRLLLEGVQRKLRERSRGKFYADGWSTSQTRTSYALVAVVMLVVLAVVYFVLGPTGIQ